MSILTKRHHQFRSTKQDYLEDVVCKLPLDTADLDYLVNMELPKLSRRGLIALLDAMDLLSRKEV